MHFVRVSCTFCQKIVQIVFSFSTCQIVRVGWGGDDNVPWTCTHVWCYANWWLRDVNILWTCTHVWCYANWWLRDVNILWTCTHVWCYANWWLRDVNILWTCTHVWCYANSLCAQRSGTVNSSLMTYCRQWQWRNAQHVLCKDLMATTGKALKHWPNLQLVWKIGPVSSPPGCFWYAQRSYFGVIQNTINQVFSIWPCHVLNPSHTTTHGSHFSGVYIFI